MQYAPRGLMAPVVCLVVCACLIPPCTAAVISRLDGHDGLVAVVDAHTTRLVRPRADGTYDTVHLGQRYEAVCAAEDGLLGFNAGSVYRIAADGTAHHCGSAPREVTEAVAVDGGGALCLAGGAGYLGRPGPDGEFRRWAEVIGRALQPAFLRTWQLRGQAVLLAGVRKTTYFDPALRLRPFVYRIPGGENHLVALWKGTSFSQPYVDAVWAATPGEGTSRLWALEESRCGGRVITGYRLVRLGVAGLHRLGAPRRLGDRLRPTAPASATAGLVCFEQVVGGWQAVKFVPQAAAAGAVDEMGGMDIAARTPLLPRRPAAWEVTVAAGLDIVVVYDPHDGLRMLELVPHGK